MGHFDPMISVNDQQNYGVLFGDPRPECKNGTAVFLCFFGSEANAKRQVDLFGSRWIKCSIQIASSRSDVSATDLMTVFLCCAGREPLWKPLGKTTFAIIL